MDVQRCDWVSNDPFYRDYHDNEWGVPVYDDQTLFELLTLETFQAGLSWLTVLRKRHNFQNAFDNFEVQKVASYDHSKVEALLQDAGIIRHRLKIQAAIINAQAFIQVQQEFGSFSKYIWGFVDKNPLINHFTTLKDIPASTPHSDQISKDLKKRGFKFVGATVIYAYMQATGMVNDHMSSCFKSLGSKR